MINCFEIICGLQSFNEERIQGIKKCIIRGIFVFGDGILHLVFLTNQLYL